MTEWRRTDRVVVRAIHDAQLAEHGGMQGVRDEGLIESTLARPKNLVAYGMPDAADLAAAYAYGITKNHGFADGNKRTGWIVARLFLADNGYALLFNKLDAVTTMESVANGMVDESAMAAWLRQRMRLI